MRYILLMAEYNTNGAIPNMLMALYYAKALYHTYCGISYNYW